MASEHPAVTNFRNYIRINSMQPNPDYAGCITWLEQQTKDLGGSLQVTECVPGKPVVVISVLGEQPNLSSILLNSHMDVVPVFPEHWKYDPFSAHKDDEGNIFGRGTQDMKCVGVQYIEALKKLKTAGHKFVRNIHISFVPDEEIGGADGMGKFVHTEEFKKLNVGFGLDEGLANPTEKFTLYYGERCPWWIWIKCPGQPGHGSQFLSNTAAEKLQKVIGRFLKFRDDEEHKLNNTPDLSLGNVTSVNLTMLKGGVQFNVVPAELSVGFDLRVPPTVDLEKFEKTITEWCTEISPDITIEFKQKTMIQNTTCVEDGKCEWWDTFSKSCKKENVNLVKEIFPAGTDCRYIRELGIPALGFSPMNHTPILLHDHNEFLNEKIFLRGVDIYCTIISDLANLPEFD